MRLNEISDEDKVYLTLKGIAYNFDEDYRNIYDTCNIVGKSINRRKILLDDIEIVCSNINLLLSQDFSELDPDIIAAKDIRNKLLDIKGKL